MQSCSVQFWHTLVWCVCEAWYVISSYYLDTQYTKCMRFYANVIESLSSFGLFKSNVILYPSVIEPKRIEKQFVRHLTASALLVSPQLRASVLNDACVRLVFGSSTLSPTTLWLDNGTSRWLRGQTWWPAADGLLLLQTPGRRAARCGFARSIALCSHTALAINEPFLVAS